MAMHLLFFMLKGASDKDILSLLLFMLIMEDLSHLITKECHLGHIQGIKITNNCTITHLLFVDNVLIFLNGSIGDLTDL